MAKLRFGSFATIQLGTGLKDWGDFKHSFASNGVKVADEMETFFGSPDFVVARRPTRVDVTIVPTSVFGFQAYPVSLPGIYRRVRRLGLNLLSPEAVLQFCLQGKQAIINLLRSRGSSAYALLLGMESIAQSYQMGRTFCLDYYSPSFHSEHQAGLWLEGYHEPLGDSDDFSTEEEFLAAPGNFYDTDEWVLALPRTK